jgi:hypothetical protein
MAIMRNSRNYNSNPVITTIPMLILGGAVGYLIYQIFMRSNTDEKLNVPPPPKNEKLNVPPPPKKKPADMNPQEFADLMKTLTVFAEHCSKQVGVKLKEGGTVDTTDKAKEASYFKCLDDMMKKYGYDQLGLTRA